MQQIIKVVFFIFFLLEILIVNFDCIVSFIYTYRLIANFLKFIQTLI